MSATLRISYGIGTDVVHIDVQTVTAVSVSVNKKVVSTPIVSKGVDATFPLESGCGKRYSFSFSRVNPTNPSDDSEDTNLWSNEKWYSNMTALMDRWQARTDGCIINFNADGTNPHQCVIDNERGYIRTLERKYDTNSNVMITGEIDISIGTMYMSREPVGLAGLYLPPVDYTYAVLDPGTLSTLPAFGKTVADVLSIGNRTISQQKVMLPLKALVATMSPETISEEDMYFSLPGLPPFWEMCRRLTAYSPEGNVTDSAKVFRGWGVGSTVTVGGTPGSVIQLSITNIRTVETVAEPLILYAIWGDAI